MILVLCDDNQITLFESLDDVRRWLEPIDVENEECRFCDDKGQQYVGVMIRPVGFFRSGTYEFRAEGQPDPRNAIDLVDQATGIAPNPWHKDLESLRRYLSGA